MTSIDIQRATLASFLWADDLGLDTKDAFLLDPYVFDGDRRVIAHKINDTTQTEDRFYSLLNMRIQNEVPHEWMEISTYTPFSLERAKLYHDDLVRERNNKIISGAAA